jgi:hypothetical protein
MRGHFNGFDISRIIHAHSHGSLKPKASEMEGHLWYAKEKVPAALRFHVPQHTAWIRLCVLLFLVESTAQDKR